MTQLLHDYGLVLLFVFVAVESAGVPIPGETVLITAAVLANPQHHQYSLLWVIVVASLAAIIGDNIGYALGRYGGRALIDRWGFVRRYAEKALPPSERFFEKHGSKAVFFGRFVAVLRVTAAWLAGLSHMKWWKFFLWNAAGGHPLGNQRLAARLLGRQEGRRGGRQVRALRGDRPARARHCRILRRAGRGGNACSTRD